MHDPRDTWRKVQGVLDVCLSSVSVLRTATEYESVGGFQSTKIRSWSVGVGNNPVKVITEPGISRSIRYLSKAKSALLTSRCFPNVAVSLQVRITACV